MRALPKLAGLLLTGLLLAMWMGTAARAQGVDPGRLRTAAGLDANLSVVLGYLKEGASPNAPDTLGRTALHYAAGGGAPRNLEALLAAGGRPDVQDGDGDTPLHVAADASSPTLGERESAAVIRVLLEGGADPNVPNRRGDTPLHVAARTHGRGDPAGVELLLRGGADPDRKNERGDTPLHAAVEPYSRHSDAVVGALLDGGANPKAVNRDGMTPLLLSVRHGPDDGRPAALLLRAGADPDRKAPDGDAPLHTAIREGGSRGKEEVVDALLAGGADPCIEDARGFIPYNVAEEGGHIHRALSRADGHDLACWPSTGAATAEAKAKTAEDALGLTRDQRRRVQQGLAEAGFDPGPADGAFGPRTRQAIGSWQDERGNEATGYLDEGQARALLTDGDEAGASTAVALEPKCSEVEDGMCWVEFTNKPGCHIWHEAPVDHGHELLSGGCTNGKAQGRVTERWDNGTTVEGPYVDGKAHGQWTVRRANGTVREGPYVDGKRHGQWTERQADGDVWEGPYVDGKRHGQWRRVAGGDCWITEWDRGERVDSRAC